MKISFTKMHGLGNDYIYINCVNQTIPDPAALSVYASRRRFGVGSDGIILIMPSDKADLRMRVFNADGSEARMCGNGIRCVAKYAYENGLVPDGKRAFTIDTLSGPRNVEVIKDVSGSGGQVKVDMGIPSFLPENVPYLSDKPLIGGRLEVGGTVYTATVLSMGNPHAVCLTDDPDKLDLEGIGPLFEWCSLFPERINTEFISMTDEKNIRMRVWERGSGETYACGTGACASAAACAASGLCRYDTDITVHLRGGDLTVNCSSSGHVYMTGSAVKVYDGILEYS